MITNKNKIKPKQLIVRLAPDTKEKLLEQAARKGMSLNTYCLLIFEQFLQKK